MEGFGERLRALMARKRLSFQMLGSAIGVSGQAVHKWVNGGGISPGHVKTIANYFRVSPAVLFFGEESLLPPHEAEILFKLRNMDSEAQKSVLDFVEYQVEQSKKRLPIREPKHPESIK